MGMHLCLGKLSVIMVAASSSPFPLHLLIRKSPFKERERSKTGVLYHQGGGFSEICSLRHVQPVKIVSLRWMYLHVLYSDEANCSSFQSNTSQ